MSIFMITIFELFIWLISIYILFFPKFCLIILFWNILLCFFIFLCNFIYTFVNYLYPLVLKEFFFFFFLIKDILQGLAAQCSFQQSQLLQKCPPVGCVHPPAFTGAMITIGLLTYKAGPHSVLGCKAWLQLFRWSHVLGHLLGQELF